MCSLATSTAAAQGLVPLGREHHGLVERDGPGRGQPVDAGPGPVVGLVEPGRAPARVDDDVLDEEDPLAPVVEHGQLADHREHGVGMAQVVGGLVGQALHLPDDVVSQVAHQAAVEGREVVQDGRAIGRQDGVHRGQHAPVEGHAGGQGALEVEGAGAGHERGRGPQTHEREAAPPLAPLHRLEQESGTGPHQAEEGGHRCDEIGQDLAPHGHDGVAGGQLVELGPARLQAATAGRR